MTDNTKIQSIDNLRVLATISVILLHVSASVALRYNPQKEDVWWIGNICDGITHFSVPMFLMLSGALLLNQNVAPLAFFKKRTSRIIYPFLFWALLYFIYYWYIQKPTSRPLGLEAITTWAFDLAKSGISYHFWFIYMLLGLYLFVPFAAKLLQRTSQKTLIVVMLLWLGLISIHTIGLYAFSNVNLLASYVPSLFGFAGYMLVGYYLNKLQVSKKQSIVFGLLFLIIGAIVTLFGTYFSTLAANKYAGSYYNFLSVNVFMQAIGIFLLFKHFKIKSKALLLIRDTISANSFGIYFVHVMVLGFLFRTGIWWGMAHSAITIPLITLGTLLISCAIIWLLKQLPFGKYFAG